MIVDERNVTGYWGPVTSTIDWCERNYAITIYIAEFWNTISNVSLMGLALFGLIMSLRHRFELRFHLLYASVVVIGIGSALFHATLQNLTQQSDELPMVWGTLTWIFCLWAGDWEHNKTATRVMPIVLTVYGIVYTVLHFHYRFTTYFQWQFAVAILSCMFRLIAHGVRTTDTTTRRLALLYFITLAAATACWLADFHLCDQIRRLPVNPQGHAWWHIFVGINSYFGPTFAQYIRAKAAGKDPAIKYALHLIPYCVIKSESDKE